MTVIAETAERAGATIRSNHRPSRQWIGLLFVAPFVALYLWLMIYPLVTGVVMSFQYQDLLSGVTEFVGWWNYEDLFADPISIGSIFNTLRFVLLTVPPFVIVGLLIALALNRPTRGAAIMRALFFGPHVLSVTVVTLIWKTVYLPNVGMIDASAAAMGLEPVSVLLNPDWALAAVGLVTVWWAIGLPMMLFLAALQQVPDDIYEAAKLDSAGPARILFTITIPSIAKMIVLVAVIEVVLQFQVFGQINLLTGGGPNNTTRTMVMFIYQAGFQQWQAGYAAAASQILFLIMLVAAGLQFWVSRKRGEA
ncbi:MAG: sugar ABC transporter permease [Devosia sp.]